MKDDLLIEVVIDVPVEVWIEAARSGSLMSLGQALECYRPYLLQTAAKELGTDLRPKEDVSDLVQETFFEAYRDFRRFSGTSAAEWRGWLRKILLHNLGHVARRYRGAAKRQLDREIPLDLLESRGMADAGLLADSSSPSSQAMGKERNDVLQQAIGRLTDRDRLALALRNQDYCTFEQIGRRLGCSAVAARKRWMRALERLRNELNDVSRTS